MKVLFFSHDNAYYGAPQALFELVDKLSGNLGVKCIVITHKYGILNKKLDSIGVENYTVKYLWSVKKPLDGWAKSTAKYFQHIVYRYFAMKKIEKIIDLQSVDIIHTNTSVIDIGASIAKKHNIYHVWHIRELMEEHFGFKAFVRDYPRYIENSSNKIVVISNAIKNVYLDKGVKESKISLVYDGIDTDLFPELTDTVEHNSKLRCVFVGKISELKGQFDVVKAVAILPKSIQNNIVVDFYGDFEEAYYNLIQGYINKNNLVNNFRFLGYTKDIEKVLNAYEIGFVCSKFEGFGRVTVEYMLSKVCPVVCDTGANKELVSNEDTGYIFRYGDIFHLAKTIEYLAENRDKIREVSLNARVTAIEKFSLKKHVGEMIELFEFQTGVSKD